MADKPVDTVAQREMWDEWWYDQFEIPNDIPDSFRRFEIEIDGEVCVGALLETAAPRTCDAFWDLMPIDAYIIHCAFFGHAAFYLDRVDMVPALGYELENRQTRMAPGDFIWDPWLKEVTFAYGRHAGMRFPTTLWYGDTPHPNQGCIFARIVENLDGFARLCKSLRYEGDQADGDAAARLIGPAEAVYPPGPCRWERCRRDWIRPMAVSETRMMKKEIAVVTVPSA